MYTSPSLCHDIVSRSQKFYLTTQNTSTSIDPQQQQGNESSEDWRKEIKKSATYGIFTPCRVIYFAPPVYITPSQSSDSEPVLTSHAYAHLLIMIL